MPSRQNNSFAGILILLFFMIGVPSFIVKEVTGQPEHKTAAVGSVSSHEDPSGTFSFSSPVVDAAGVMSPSSRSELESFLVALNATKGIQIGVLIVSDMDGEDIESFSMRHAEQWKLGIKGVDNGALLVVAMKEHGVRIETGYGAEGVLTDAKCARILRNIIVPAFKSGDYEKGISDGVKTMAAIISQDESMVKAEETISERKSRGNTIPVPVVLFIIVWVAMLFGALTSTVRRSRGGIFFVPVGGFGRGHWDDHHGSGGFGGSSGGFGGGGFSGGGGSFGGGGASSSW